MATDSGESAKTKGQEPYGRALWPDQAKADVFAVVKKATAVVKVLGTDRAGKDDGKSPRTLDVYRRLAKGRAEVTAEGGNADGWRDSRQLAHHQGGRSPPSRGSVQRGPESGGQDARSRQSGRSGGDLSQIRKRLCGCEGDGAPFS